jgi:hypothetical protein
MKRKDVTDFDSSPGIPAFLTLIVMKKMIAAIPERMVRQYMIKPQL